MNVNTPGKEQVPIGEGLFVIPSSPSGKPYLVGSRCRNCGEVVFPVRRACRKCTSMDLETVPLNRKAKLYAFTTVVVKLPDAKLPPPYLVGIVELPEGERIRTLLGGDISSLKIGEEMEVAIEKVYVDEQGKDVLGWRFYPAGKGIT